MLTSEGISRSLLVVWMLLSPSLLVTILLDAIVYESCFYPSFVHALTILVDGAFISSEGLMFRLFLSYRIPYSISSGLTGYSP